MSRVLRSLAIYSKFLEDEISIKVQQTMMPKQYDGELWYHLAAIQYKLYNSVEMSLGSGQGSRVDIVRFKSCEVCFGRGYVITISKEKSYIRRSNVRYTEL